MYGIKSDVFISVLRHILTFAGGFVVAKGWISADQSAELVGSLISIIGIAFAVFFHASSNGTIETISTTSNAVSGVEQKTTTTVTGVAPDMAAAKATIVHAQETTEAAKQATAETKAATAELKTAIAAAPTR